MFGLAHDDWVPACLAPAVRSGIYTYHGRTGLAVNGLPRCHKAQLLEHLAFVDPGPALTKKGKPRVRQPPRPQDQSVEFYRAQMVHYGLASTPQGDVTREAAKAALGATALAVPRSVLDVEAKLKKLYDAENDKMRRAAVDKQRAEEAAEQARRKKRDREEEDLIKNVLSDQPPPGKRAKSGKPKTSNSSQPLNLDTVSGIYTLVAPKVSSNWEIPYDGIVFKLAVSPKRSHIWGSFDFGPFEGTLRSTGSLTSPDGTIRFHWRGRDTGSGESTFGPDNVGFIQFLAGGKIKGDLAWDCCDGAIAFAGACDSEKKLQTEDEDGIRGWKDEYWSLNEENYEHESRRRWGGYSYNPSEEREANSDTEEEEPGDNESGYESENLAL